jgi:hypothetical protein
MSMIFFFVPKQGSKMRLTIKELEDKLSIATQKNLIEFKFKSNWDECPESTAPEFWYLLFPVAKKQQKYIKNRALDKNLIFNKRQWDICFINKEISANRQIFGPRKKKHQ